MNGLQLPLFCGDDGAVHSDVGAARITAPVGIGNVKNGDVRQGISGSIGPDRGS